jgi:hypothetical protein
MAFIICDWVYKNGWRRRRLQPPRASPSPTAELTATPNRPLSQVGQWCDRWLDWQDVRARGRQKHMEIRTGGIRDRFACRLGVGTACPHSIPGGCRGIGWKSGATRHDWVGFALARRAMVNRGALVSGVRQRELPHIILALASDVATSGHHSVGDGRLEIG